jgi:hypothetical protein
MRRVGAAAYRRSMATSGTPTFGTGRLFLADSRLALAAVNEIRHWGLNRLFGLSREQANLLTAVVAFTAADAAYETARRVVRAPLGVSGADAALGWFTVREAALGIAGPQDRNAPLTATLLTLAVLGGVVLPGVRRAAVAFREAERRVRLARIRRYIAATVSQPS